MSAAPRVARWKVTLAFACIYLIWGSTYLAIRWAVEDVPPFLMASSRLVPAGLALLAWQLARGDAPPAPRHWLSALGVGGLMLLGGNGAVVWSETRVPSGLAALMVASVPLWVALLQGLAGGPRPGPRAWSGLALGLAGIVVLVGPESLAGGRRIDLLAAAALLVGSLSWSAGSLIARRVPLPASPLLGAAMEMIAGGALLAVTGLALGEGARLDLARVGPRAVLSILYLATFGSIVGFTAYVWLLGVVAPSRVATYAFVNPVVAVLLGWALAGEPLTARTLLAAAIIVGAVALITLGPLGSPAPDAALAEEPPA